MKFGLKKKLCMLSFIGCFTVVSVFADNEQYNPEVLLGFVQQSRMTDLSEQYILDIEKLLTSQIDNSGFEEAKKTADYLIDISTKYYGSDNIKTSNSYLHRASLFTKYVIPDLALNDIKKAALNIKKDSNLKKLVYDSYAKLFEQIKQPYDSINYVNKMYSDSQITKTDEAKKFRRISHLYSNAAENQKAIDFMNDAIENYKNDTSSNPFDLMGAYSELIDIINIVDIPPILKKHSDIANSFKPEILGAKVDANLKELQYFDKVNQLYKYKNLLDDTAKLVDKVPDDYRLSAINWLYISYYNQVNDLTNLDKYRKNLTNSQVDWNSLPSNSLLWINKYVEEMNTCDFEQAKQAVNKALRLIEPVKKYAPLMYSDLLMKNAQIDLAMKNYNSVAKLLKEVEKVLKKLDYDPKYQTANLYNVYADFYKAQNDNEKALEYINKSISKLHELGNDNFDLLLDKYLKQADIYAAMGNKDKAIASVDKLISTTKALYGENNVKTYDVIYNVSNYCKCFDEEKSAALYKEVFDSIENSKVSGVLPILFYSVYITESRNALNNKDFVAANKYAQKSLTYSHNNRQKYDAYDILMYSSYAIPQKRALAPKYQKLRDSLKLSD